MSPAEWQLKGQAPQSKQAHVLYDVGQPAEPRETLQGYWLIFLAPRIVRRGLYSLLIIGVVGGQGILSPVIILFYRVLGESRKMSNFRSSVNGLVMQSNHG